MVQGSGAQHVNPVRSARNPEPGLIQMFHGGFLAGQPIFHRFGKTGHLLGHFWRSDRPA